MNNSKKLTSCIRSESMPNIEKESNDQVFDRRSSIMTYLSPLYRRFVNNKQKIKAEMKNM